MKKIQFIMKSDWGTVWTIKSSYDRIIEIRDDVRNQLQRIDEGKSQAKFLYVTDSLILNVDDIKSIDVSDVEDNKDRIPSVGLNPISV